VVGAGTCWQVNHPLAPSLSRRGITESAPTVSGAVLTFLCSLGRRMYTQRRYTTARQHNRSLNVGL
jgi:hypothetical protein